MSHTGYASLINTIIIKIILHTYLDYDWVIKFKKTYPVRSTEKEEPAEGFVPLAVTEEPVPALDWSVEHLVLRSPKGDVLEIKSTSLFVVAELLHKMS